MRRLAALLTGLLAAGALVPAGASAHWRTTGAGSATAATGSFAAAANVTAGPSPSGGTVAVGWDAATLSTGASATGYYVTRSDGSTTVAACGSSATSPVSGLGCSDSDVPEGRWSYTVTAVYHSWTARSSASGTVTVDRTAPSAPSLTTPADGTAQQSRTIVVSGSAEPGATVRVANAGTAIGTPATAGAGGDWTVTLSGLADGTYVLTAKATDAAGNTSPASAARTVTVDNVAPSTSITSGPSGSTTATSASFAFTASQSGSTFECSLDGAAYAPCTSPKAYSGLSTGDHTFRVRATDPAGNVDATGASQTWTVAATPDTSIASSPSALTNQSTAAFTYTSTVSGSTYECALDGAAYAACPSTGKSYSGLGAGSHTFTVRATANGATDASPASFTWSIDQTAPFGSDFALTNKAGGTAGQIDSGDKISLTYSEAMDPSSLVAGWDGTGSRTVKVQFFDNNSSGSSANDQITQFYLDTGTTTVPLGSISMNANYVRTNGGGSVNFVNSTLTMLPGATTFEIVLGTPDVSATMMTVTTKSGMVWAPAAGAKDRAGNATDATRTVSKSMIGF